MQSFILQAVCKEYGFDDYGNSELINRKATSLKLRPRIQSVTFASTRDLERRARNAHLAVFATLSIRDLVYRLLNTDEELISSSPL
jgi:hypothetical protein